VLQYLGKKRRKKEKKKKEKVVSRLVKEHTAVYSVHLFQLQLRYFYMLTAILHNPVAYSIKSSLIRLELKIEIPSRL